MVPHRLSAAAVVSLCAALVLAGCGGGSSRSTSDRVSCSKPVAAALGPGTRMALRARALDSVTCVYATPRSGARVRVTVDTAPQASTRFERWVVERGQAYLGAPRAQLPQVLSGIGDGAAWVPAAHELRTTAHDRLVTVVVAHAAHGTSARATAIGFARAAL